MIDTVTVPGALPFATQLKTLMDLEGRYQPKLSGLRIIDSAQDNGLRMTARLRELEVKDLLSLTRFFGFSSETFSLATSLLDRFLSVMKVCTEMFKTDILLTSVKLLIIVFPVLHRFNQNTYLVWACAAFTLLWNLQRRRRTCLWPMTWSASVRIASQCLTWFGWRRSSWRNSTGRWRPLQPSAFFAYFTATSRSSSTLIGKDRRPRQPAGRNHDSTKSYLLSLNGCLKENIC